MAFQLNLPVLPQFITAQNKLAVGGIGFIICALLYLSCNHYPIFEPQLLTLTAFDRAIPFIPETVFIYTTEYLFFVVIYLSAKDILNLNKYLYSFMFQQIVAIAIFWIWPTIYPRELFPLDPNQLNSLTYSVFSGLRHLDAPTNCAPSLHVSSVYLSSFIFLDEQRHKFKFFIVWGTLIALSTLTTKQHYIVDVVSGLLLAVFSYWIFHKMFRYQR